MANKVIADPHFGHFNIIRYCDRPFSSAEEMNNTIIRNWNWVVDEDDTVYVLGDFAFGRGSKELIEPIARSLLGNKILIKGNHDRESNGWYLKRGFQEVHGGEFYQYQPGVYLSHYPCPRRDDIINIYGHVHNLVRITNWNYRCVSVEQINYTPVDLDELILEIRSNHEESSM